MSSRAVKRALQAQGLDQKSMVAKQEAAHVSEDEVDDYIPTQRSGNAFAMLLEDDGEQSQSDQDKDDGSEKEEEDVPMRENSVRSQPQPTNTSKARKAKKLKQQMKKEREAAIALDEPTYSDAELDAQLKEMEILDKEVGLYVNVEGNKKAAKAGVRKDTVLSVNRSYLNPENEMKRLFGSRTINEQSASNVGGRGRGRYTKKFWLAQPKPTWPAWVNPGLHMERDSTLAVDDEGLFCFQHGKSYREIEKVFLQAVDSLDPNNIVAVLNRHPCHIDSLLQLAEVCNIQGDRQTAADLIERVLYIHESCFNSRFRLGDPQMSRLSYKNYENRGFFLALFHHSEKLSQKGCWRTALEVCKILFGLDNTDPLGALLVMDTYALQSREYEWLLDFNKRYTDKHMELLPNFSFSLALSAYQREWEIRQEPGFENSGKSSVNASDMESTIRLENALLLFPDMLVPLATAADIALDISVTTNSFFKTTEMSSTIGNSNRAVLGLIKLYIARAVNPWKEPNVGTWVRATVAGLVRKISRDSSIAEAKRLLRESAYNGEGSRSIARHIVLSANSEALSTLPDLVKSESTRMFDPLPPLDGSTPYSRTGPAEITSAQSALNLFLRSIMPSFGVEEAQQLVYREQEEGGEAGGLQLNVDLLREMLASFTQDVNNMVHENLGQGQGRGDEENDD
eukprot:CFRG1468T1